jgi:hypothetical protein
VALRRINAEDSDEATYYGVAKRLDAAGLHGDARRVRGIARDEHRHRKIMAETARHLQNRERR